MTLKLLWGIGAPVIVGVFALGYFYTAVPRIPPLDRPFTPASRYPEDIRQLSIDKVNAATAELRENPDLVSRWLEIAVYRKGADDFDGAEEIWIYMTKKWPGDPTAYANLANLYQLELNKPRAAARYWRKYIEIVPEGYRVAGYRSLHDLYRTKLADEDKARDVLLEGLARYPDSTDLMVPLAVFERDRGNLDEARTYFTQAKDIADRLGNAALSSILAEELEKLGR